MVNNAFLKFNMILGMQQTLDIFIHLKTTFKPLLALLFWLNRAIIIESWVV